MASPAKILISGGVGQDHARRYFADSARQNVHESAFIKDRGISGDTEEMAYTL